MSSFFRRLAFSPDGLLLVAPGMCCHGYECVVMVTYVIGGIVDGADVTWIFTTSSLPKLVYTSY